MARGRRGWLRIRRQDLTPEGLDRLERMVRHLSASCLSATRVALAIPAYRLPGDRFEHVVVAVPLDTLVMVLRATVARPDMPCGLGLCLRHLPALLAIRRRPPTREDPLWHPMVDAIRTAARDALDPPPSDLKP